MHEVVGTAPTNDKAVNTKPAKHGKTPKANKTEKGGESKKCLPLQKNKQKCAFMYVGPNVLNEHLFTGSLYKDSLPEYFEEKFEKLPELKKLFIDVNTLPVVKKELAEQGTMIYSLYQYVETKIQEGVLKDGI